MFIRSAIVALIFFVSGIPLAAKEKIFFIAHAGAGDPFWNIEFKGAKQAASDLNIDLTILAPEKPNDIARQVELFKAALATRPSGIALSISDDRAFSAMLSRAKAEGIHVVAFNSKPSEKFISKNPYSAFIGMDEFQAGVSAARRAWNSGRIKNQVVVAIHQAGHIGLEKRYAGIKHFMDQKKIKTEKLDTGSDPARVQMMFRSYYKNNPEISAVFTVGPSGLHPIARLIDKEKLNVYLASFDLTPLTLNYIKKGTVAFTIDQQPYMQGYLSVAQLALASRTLMVPASVNTGVGVIDLANAVSVQKLVHQGIR